jgi:RND family efflux transporter MFP subunit
MHPQVVQDHPGTCPICHMDLTALRASGPSLAPGERQVRFYRNPMDPMVTSPVPMKDAMGMDYVPVYADEVLSDAGPEVIIDPGLIQRMNVTTMRVERRDLSRTVRTVGYVAFDHELESTVTVKFAGYVEHVHVHLVGEKIRRGQPLFDVYSPELVQTQQDLLAALAFAERLQAAEVASPATLDRARALVVSARERLRLWDISPAQIERIENTGAVSRVLTVSAPRSGVITEQPQNLVGMEIRPGMSIYRIADTSRAWVTAEVYEDQIAVVQSQDHAWVTLAALPGERLEAEVLAIKPWVERETRTVHLTLGLANEQGRLRQGMQATVEFEPVTVSGALLLPSQSVLRTGQRNIVVVAKGEGRFAPREVTLGAEANGEIQIVSGLDEGEEIVTSAQFLIDSESSLKAAVQAMLAGRTP